MTPAFLALCLLAQGLGALAPALAAAAVKNPDAYTYLAIGGPDTLDPAWADDTASMLVIRNVYETLLGLGEGEALRPLLSTKVPSRKNGLVSADGLTYTFPIRTGVRFHDGAELTPEDVRYSLLRFVLKDRAGGPSPWLLEPLTGAASTRDEDGRILDSVYERAVRAVRVEGGSVVVRLAHPHPPLLAVLAAWAPALSRRWAAAQGDWDGSSTTWKAFNGVKPAASRLDEAANGTGPWRLERWDKVGRQVVLARHEGYWRGPARLARVVLKAMEEFGARRLALMAGDADVIQADWSQYSQMKDLPGVRLIEGLEVPSVNPALYFTFAVSTAANPNVGSGRLDGDGIPGDFFADRDMRKAWAHCIDYEGFVRDVYRGAGRQAAGFIPRGMPGHDAAAPVHRFDLKQAEAHARKAWNGRVWEKGFRMTLAYNAGNTHREALALMLKRNLEGLNPRFRIDVRPYQWPTYLDMMRSRRLPAFMVGWVALFPDPHAAAFMFMHSRGAFPSAQGWRDPRADALVTEGLREADPGRRRRVYRDLLRLAHEEAPHVVIVEGTRFRAQRDWVKGWSHQPLFPDAPYGGDFYPLYKQ